MYKSSARVTLGGIADVMIKYNIREVLYATTNPDYVMYTGVLYPGQGSHDRNRIFKFLAVYVLPR